MAHVLARWLTRETENVITFCILTLQISTGTKPFPIRLWAFWMRKFSSTFRARSRGERERGAMRFNLFVCLVVWFVCLFGSRWLDFNHPGWCYSPPHSGLTCIQPGTSRNRVFTALLPTLAELKNNFRLDRNSIYVITWNIIIITTAPTARARSRMVAAIGTIWCDCFWSEIKRKDASNNNTKLDSRSARMNPAGLVVWFFSSVCLGWWCLCSEIMTQLVPWLRLLFREFIFSVCLFPQ